jgi:hypothetical protein
MTQIEKTLEELNKIREDVHLALQVKKTYPFRWNSQKSRFESATAGYSFDNEQKKVVKSTFETRGITIKFYQGRNESGYTIKVDDPGLQLLTSTHT